MPEPIIFISHQRIKAGMLDGYKEYYREVANFVEQTKPQTLANLGYLNADGTEMNIVIVFADAEAMQVHMQGMGELAKRSLDYMEVVALDIYGKPSDMVLEMMKKMAGSGVTLNIKPQHVGGYLRFKPG